MNRLIIAGNLGRDPDTRYFESGNVVSRLSIAVTNYRKETTWFTAECWGKSAESAVNYLRKGQFVIVEGEAAVECWLSKQTGEPNAKPVVKNARWYFGGKNDNDAASSQYANNEF